MDQLSPFVVGAAGVAGLDSVVVLADALSAVPTGLFASPAGALPELVAAASPLPPDAAAGVAGFSLAAGLAPLFRKSVTYHPEPFNWNPAADTSFRSSGFWHDGQTVIGASLNFCSASSSCPHAAHRYS
jgi:hypothetical protein